MNKYIENLKIAYEMMNNTDFGSAKIGCNALKILTELVDKATPRKVEIKVVQHWIDYYCPVCSHKLRRDVKYKYCPHCGQALDRSCA